MIKVGLSGSMASGKSTLSRVWSELGAYTLNADTFAKELMQSDPKIIREIKATFGKESYLENGQLNRVFLAEEAFKKERVDELNAIVHPLLKEEVNKKMLEAESKGEDCFLYEAAILLNEGRPPYFDLIIWIEAPKQRLIERSIKRSKITSIEAEKRLHFQRSLTDVLSYVDIVLFNDSDIDHFQSQATKLYGQLKKFNPKRIFPK